MSLIGFIANENIFHVKHSNLSKCHKITETSPNGLKTIRKSVNSLQMMLLILEWSNTFFNVSRLHLKLAKPSIMTGCC